MASQKPLAFHLGRHWRWLLPAVLALLVLVSWLALLDGAAIALLDAGGLRAVASFAVARALNAGISVLQGTEIAVQPMGLGVTLAVGQFLDPVNDLVEHFANLMLLAAVAFGVEGLLVRVGAHWLVSLLLTLVAGAWGYLVWRQQAPPAWLSRTLMLLLLVRLALPLAFIGSDAVFRHFLEADYRASTQVVERFSGQVGTLTPGAAPQDAQGVLEQLKGWGGGQISDFKARLLAVKQAAEQVTERIIKLMVVFIVQTLVLPLLLFWFLGLMLRGAFEPRPRLSRRPVPRSRTPLLARGRE